MNKSSFLRSRGFIMLLVLVLMVSAFAGCTNNETGDGEETNAEETTEPANAEETTNTPEAAEVIDVEGTVWRCYKTTVDGEETSELQDSYGGKYYYMFEENGVLNSMMLGNIADNTGTYSQDGDKVSVYQGGDVELVFVGDELQFTYWGILFHFELSSMEAMEAELNE